jgi:NAD(P)-dependent dehydrogenase (short-subunit alcohol dehydrogenase family)
VVGIVVGATGGIGSACAQRLELSADRLVLVGRSTDKLTRLPRMRNAVLVQADISTSQGRDAVVDAVDGSPISWLVVASGVPLRGTLTGLAADNIEEAIAINFTGPVLLIRRLLECEWIEGAAIAVVGSISASRALPNRAIYGGTKAGLEHVCTSLAAELAPRGIRINVVAPGVIDTPFLGDNKKMIGEWIEDRVPARRLGTSDEVAQVVEYVLMDAPGFLTGARIAVDGGAEVVG